MRKPWLKFTLALLAGAGLALSAEAQDPTSTVATGSSTPAAPAHDLSQLKPNRAAWPAQLTLKKDVRMAILSNGQPVGAIVSPEGATVDLIAVNDTTLTIGVVDARATVAPEDTDLWERLDAAAQKAAPGTSQSPAPTATAAAPSLPPTNRTTPSPVPSPALPPVSPTPAPAASTPAAETGKPFMFDYSASPVAGARFTKADFRFWCPAYAQPVRGVIVLVPGFNGDGRGKVTDPAWQALARKYRLALTASSMQGGAYYEAAHGTGDALQSALENFATQSSHDEVKRVPLLLYGESAGGQFDYDYVVWKPERVMAFIVNKGGYYVDDLPGSQACAVPGIFFLGQKDADFRIKAITGIWTTGRKNGALWALAPQPNSGHEFSKTAPVARIFFEAVLKNRLPDDLTSSDDTPSMKPMQESQGWLGDLTTHEIRAVGASDQPALDAAWLPDEATANAWKTFVSEGQ